MPPPQKPGEYPVIERAYELVKWSAERVQKFPRGHRFTLGERMQQRLYRMLERLLEARYTKQRLPVLQAANLDLEVLRFQFRLAHDLRCLSTDSYGHASRLLVDVGSQVGGWIRSQPIS